MQKIYIKAQKIDGLFLDTYEIVLTNFQIVNNINRA